jgi:hypothetical protein
MTPPRVATSKPSNARGNEKSSTPFAKRIFRKEPEMAKPSLRQRKTIGRVMHEYEHGELKSGRSGKAGKVKSRRQAVAIALNEAGASKYNSKKKNKRNLVRSERKETAGKTYQQEAEGTSRVGARGKRESSRAMGGKDATKPTRRGLKASRTRAKRARAQRA